MVGSLLLGGILACSAGAWGAPDKCSKYFKKVSASQLPEMATRIFHQEEKKLPKTSGEIVEYLPLLRKTFETLAQKVDGMEVRPGVTVDGPDLVVVLNLGGYKREYWNIYATDNGRQFRAVEWTEDAQSNLEMRGWKRDLLEVAPGEAHLFRQILPADLQMIPMDKHTDWALQIQGKSPYAVREEVRRATGRGYKDVREQLVADQHRYRLSFHDYRQELAWVIFVDFIHNAKGQVSSIRLGQYRVPWKKTAAGQIPQERELLLDYGGKYLSSLEDLNLWLGNYLAMVAKKRNLYPSLFPFWMRDLPGLDDEVADRKFNRYRSQIEDYADLWRTRPGRIWRANEGSAGKVKQELQWNAELAKKLENEEYILRLNEKGYTTQHNIFAQVASWIMPFENLAYATWMMSDEGKTFSGRIDLANGHALYYIIRDTKAETSEYYVMAGIYGFVRFAAAHHPYHPGKDFVWQAIKQGQVQHLEGENDSYYANIDYPSRPTIESLQTTVRKFMAAQKKVDFKISAVQEGKDGEKQFQFTLALPKASQKTTQMRERFVVAWRPTDDLTKGFQIQRHLIWHNPFTGQPEQEIALPLLQHHHRCDDFDGLFEEVRQILGNYLKAWHDLAAGQIFYQLEEAAYNP
ncbi:MAG: hypothetical protein J6Y94_03115 [Bacteriovoracaceae bacterium]|nr:hypothetical protein [Bacteriovoracaceae bacterium]